MTTDHNLEFLREAFTSTEATAPAGCPAPETIWSAVRGELPPGEIREVVDHTSLCPSCAEDWRLAVAFAEESAGFAAEQPVPGRVAGFGRLLRTAGFAAAAALVVATAGITLVNRQAGPGAPVFREGTSLQVRSLIPEGETLPRDRCVLSWEVEGGVPGSTFYVLVGSKDMPVVAQADGLTRPVFEVPEEALARLPPEAELAWQVRVMPPAGEPVTSESFKIRVR